VDARMIPVFFVPAEDKERDAGEQVMNIPGGGGIWGGNGWSGACSMEWGGRTSG
jgi:hypothetical protein